MTHIMVVDDDQQVLRSVQRILDDAGYTACGASSGEEALRKISQEQPDLVVLDIIMPDMDGLEVCRRIRADPFTAKLPVLFLTAKGRPNDIVEGLDVGGDDYLTKPFDIVELPARIRALLRRAPGGALDPESEHIRAGELQLHTTRPEILIQDQLLELTAVEHRLLHYLMIHAGQPISTQRLLEDVWEYYPGTGNPKLVQVHIANLRAKFEAQTGASHFIRNVRGRGYLIDD